MRPRYERSAFFGDFHVPYEDAACVRVMLDFCEWFKPHIVFLIGDIMDFYQISRWDKSPERILKMQDDINDTKDLLERIRRSNPKAVIVFLEGNHCNRLLRWKWQHPEASSLEALTIPQMFTLSDYKIQHLNYLQTYNYHGFLVEHGDIVRKNSGYTARAMFEKRGASGLSGHSHRLAMFYHTHYGGDFVWCENGCMCNRDPEWVKKPDWLNGFTYGWFKQDADRFTVQQICIPDGMCVVHGKELPILR